MSDRMSAYWGTRRSLLRYGVWMMQCAWLLLVLPGTGLAELQNENLLQNLPKGYKVAYQGRKGNVGMSIMIPKVETAKNWTEMVTTQVFFGLKQATPEKYKAYMAEKWLPDCKKRGVAPIRQGEENGYHFAFWVQSCAQNAATGKPENAWIKAIRGNDSFYVVEKVYRFAPSKEQVTKSMKFFSSIRVCDSRLADRACPKFEKTKK